MLELGSTAAELHQEVGREAARRADLLILLGDFAPQTAAGARQGGLRADRIVLAASHDEAVRQLQKQLQAGDRVLIKGSRGMTMERICTALKTEGKRRVVGHP
jgi:UDP-N-acetylmuramoyl-tripeptide--D-alanyl-D-alanine ligase